MTHILPVCSSHAAVGRIAAGEVEAPGAGVCQPTPASPPQSAPHTC